MSNNHIQVSQGFRLLRAALAPYLARELEVEAGDGWWESAVLNTLYDDQKRDLPLAGETWKLVDSLDIARCLLLFDLHWNEVFRKKLSVDHRTWAKELTGWRNKLAHIGGADFSEDDTWRALDIMSRLCEQIDAAGAEEIRKLLRTVRYGSENGSASLSENRTEEIENSKHNSNSYLLTPISSSLPCWRDVMEPHPDVAQGRYKNAEFAADLAQVARGEGAYEYRDPVEFFARTFVTEGMTGLLEQALRRVCGKDGEPVIQLKTAFGGGKTHSMLALYHLLRGTAPVEKIPNIKPVLQRAGLSSLPRANVAVIVGTALDPAKSRRPATLPGVTINTLWGEMASQIAESAGKPELYDIVKEADKKGVSPGSVALKNLFDAASPCLVLMDELVAYAKKIYGANNLPAGTFDNFITFIQEVTEAARVSKNSIVVASIPESDIEIGGEAGHTALETIEHTFGRMESIWKPVSATEGFEVVRRRLFLPCKNPDGRDAACAAFSRFYAENTGDFPLETKELEYKNRMVSCYPIHPEVFDRLYEDWATLERFQRTRGVLRLMAAVIHELWMGADASLLIMPGSLPLDVPNVRDELTRHLSEGWNAIVDHEVDGKNSVPYQKDQANPRYGKSLAARRIARTIMLGSAPTVGSRVRGIEASRVRLGVIQPGENIANFNDALTSLKSALAYLYTNPSGDRFWYDTRPTLRKTVEDRATQIAASDVEYEIENRLRALRKEPPFAGVHICPASSLDVPDEQIARLVILRPADEYKTGVADCPAMTAVTDILNNRGNTPRIYRNMLGFLAPDQTLIVSLNEAARLYLAWKSVKADSEDLNLDAAQNRETDNNLRRSNETVDARVKEAYCWLIVPYIDKNVDMKTILYDTSRLSGGNDGIITKAAKRMLQNEAVITRWAPALLLMELNNLLWRDVNHINIKQLWDYLCTYCYLPRLAGESVLLDAIHDGVESSEYFAYSEGQDSTGRYEALTVGTSRNFAISPDGLIVRVEAAKAQLQKEAEASETETYAVLSYSGGDGLLSGFDEKGGILKDGVKSHYAPAAPSKGVTHFYGSVKLDDLTKIGQTTAAINLEVLQHFVKLPKAGITVKMDIEVSAPEGMPDDLIRTIRENCRTLKFETGDFGE
ncbi:MAG: DUF499 domain-containing protein [Treponematales bacterium]